MKPDFETTINKQVAKLEKMKADLSWLPDLPEGEAILAGGYSFRIGLRFDRALMATCHQAMLDQGWEVLWSKNEREVADSEWYPYAEYTKDSHSIELVYFTFQEGSTCQRREVGKITKEVPLYEFACASTEQ